MPLADRLIRFAATISVVILAVIAFTVSYRHCYHLALRLGEDNATSILVPFTVDLLVLASALTSLFCNRYALPVPRLARLGLMLGIGATIAVNVAEGITRGIWAAIFGAWPALALVIATELLLALVAAARSLETRTVLVVEHEEETDPLLDRAVEALAKDRNLSGAALGRMLGISYVKALDLHKTARKLVNVTL